MENLNSNFQGIIIGLSTFLIIGLFHPLVIKGEYYFGVRVWWVFALTGVASLIGAFLCHTVFWAGILAVISFSCFWSIKEVFEQRKRVLKGWFPSNPKRKEKKERSARFTTDKPH